MAADAPEQPFTLVASAAREQAERTFGERLRTWVARSGARPVDVAALLAVKRQHLYKVFDDRRPMLAAWLELLPPAVELLYLAERATHHGLELRSVTVESTPSVQLHVMVGELTDVLRVAADSESDGQITVEEAERELAQWDDVERIAPIRRAQLRAVVKNRGAVVRLRSAR